jgi:hypothetical protein
MRKLWALRLSIAALPAAAEEVALYPFSLNR